MKDMNKFAVEMEKMEVTAECWDDMIDIFDSDDVEVESDNVMNQVLDELGISLNAQLVDAPSNKISLPQGETVLNFPSVKQQAYSSNTKTNLAV